MLKPSVNYGRKTEQDPKATNRLGRMLKTKKVMTAHNPVAVVVATDLMQGTLSCLFE